MKIGIMQPYFFPYLGYYDLINRTDKWLVFDIVQYKPKSWMNRNRILHPKEGWQYITVPVAKAPRVTKIQDIRIKDVKASKKRILGQIKHYKKKAPYFERGNELVKHCFDGLRSNRLVELNVRSLEVVCAYLKIPLKFEICSQMLLNLPEITHPGRWALEISSQQGANEYINLPGGKKIFCLDDFKKRNIQLSFTEPFEFVYSCHPYNFINNLSVLDVIMWISPEAILDLLNGLQCENQIAVEKVSQTQPKSRLLKKSAHSLSTSLVYEKV